VWILNISVAVIYTMIWNMFDFPAGVVRFGTESGENIDGYDTEGDFILEIAKKVHYYMRSFIHGKHLT